MNIKTGQNSLLYSFFVAISIFIVSFSVLSIVGLVPKSLDFLSLNEKNKAIDDSFVKNSEQSLDIDNGSYTRPDRIIVDKVGIDSVIEKPDSINVSVLDNSLNKGAVHYPGSGTVEKGNIFLFGHSTNWNVVQNEAYKTFNGLEKLEKNDEITIEANGELFIYKVTSVVLVDAENALVEFDNSKRTLTVSTCNTFGEKQERWVVNAEFYEKV